MNSNYISYMIGRKMAQNTIDTYTRHVNSMLEYISKDESDITSMDMMNWQASISNQAPATVGNKISAVNDYFNFLVDFGVIPSNPAAKLVKPKIVSKEKEYMDKDMISAMIANAGNPRDRAMILLASTTGLRISELTGISINQYQDMIQNGRNYIISVGKGGKERKVFINYQTRCAIEEYLEVRPECDCPYLFLGRQKYRVETNHFGQTLKKIARKAEIPFWQEISPHWLRAATATIMADNGIHISVIQKTLNHSSPKTTARYIKNSDEQLMEANEGMVF